MKEEDLQNLIELRNLLIHGYNKLDRNANPGTSVILQRDVAAMIESSMSKLDGVLSRHVTIKESGQI